MSRNRRPALSRKIVPGIGKSVHVEPAAAQLVLTKSSQLLEAEGEGRQGDWIPQPVNFRQLAAQWNPYHRACIQAKVDLSIGLGWTGPGGVGEVPIPGNARGESPLDVLTQAATDLEDTGCARVELVFSRAGQLVETYWAPAQYMEAHKDHQRVRQVVDGRGAGQRVMEWPIWRGSLPEPGADGARRAILCVNLPGTWSTYYGQPQWLGCIQDLLLADSATRAHRGLFDNGMIPSYLVTMSGMGLDDGQEVDADGEPIPDLLDQLETFMAENYQGAANAGRAFFAKLPNPEAKLEFKALQQPYDESYPLGKVKADTRDAILSGHRVPPRLLSIVVGGQLSGGSETIGQLRMFEEGLMVPRRRLWEAQWNTVLPFIPGAPAALEFRRMDLGAYSIQPSSTAGGQPAAPMPADDEPAAVARGARWVQKTVDQLLRRGARK